MQEILNLSYDDDDDPNSKDSLLLDFSSPSADVPGSE